MYCLLFIFALLRYHVNKYIFVWKILKFFQLCTCWKKTVFPKSITSLTELKFNEISIVYFCRNECYLIDFYLNLIIVYSKNTLLNISNKYIFRLDFIHFSRCYVWNKLITLKALLQYNFKYWLNNIKINAIRTLLILLKWIQVWNNYQKIN